MGEERLLFPSNGHPEQRPAVVEADLGIRAELEQQLHDVGVAVAQDRAGKRPAVAAVVDEVGARAALQQELGRVPAIAESGSFERRRCKIRVPEVEVEAAFLSLWRRN